MPNISPTASLTPENLEAWARLPITPILHIVTVQKSDEDGERKRAQWRTIAQPPYHRLLFIHPHGGCPGDVSPKESHSYPLKVAGNLFNIRRWAEDEFANAGPFFLADGDPGYQYISRTTHKRQPYMPCRPKIVIPDLVTIGMSGGSRKSLNGEELALLERGLIYFGQKLDRIAYVGFNASEQPTTPISQEWRSSGKYGESFGSYAFQPFQIDAALTGIVGVLRPMRRFISPKYRNFSQEWTIAAATAVNNKYHTLKLRSLIFKFAVNPPANGQELQDISKAFPTIVGPGNAAGSSNGAKTGTVVKFLTEKIIQI